MPSFPTTARTYVRRITQLGIGVVSKGCGGCTVCRKRSAKRVLVYSDSAGSIAGWNFVQHTKYIDLRYNCNKKKCDSEKSRLAGVFLQIWISARALFLLVPIALGFRHKVNRACFFRVNDAAIDILPHRILGEFQVIGSFSGRHWKSAIFLGHGAFLTISTVVTIGKRKIPRPKLNRRTTELANFVAHCMGQGFFKHAAPRFLARKPPTVFQISLKGIFNVLSRRLDLFHPDGRGTRPALALG